MHRRTAHTFLALNSTTSSEKPI